MMVEVKRMMWMSDLNDFDDDDDGFDEDGSDGDDDLVAVAAASPPADPLGSQGDADNDNDDDIDDKVNVKRLRVSTYNVDQGVIKKWITILRWAANRQLHVIGLQEVGDPVIPAKLLAAYGWHGWMDAAKHRGVMLLIRSELVPYVKKVLTCHERNKDVKGSLIGVIVEVKKQSTLLLSVYMPTSLDSAREDSEAMLRAHRIYHEMTDWMKQATRTVIMGDFNQTVSRVDREMVDAKGDHIWWWWWWFCFCCCCCCSRWCPPIWSDSFIARW